MTEARYPHIDYSGLPENMRGGVRRYIEHGIEPGGFMTAVICNDLRDALGRADSVNARQFFEIVAWLYEYAPASCWGSPAAFEAWMNQQEFKCPTA